MDTQPERVDPAYWKIIAEISRENNTRDVKIAKIEADLEAMRRIISQVDGLDHMAAEAKTALAAIQGRALTDVHLRALTLLAEVFQRRGTLDLFSEEEMGSLRSLLRERPERVASLVDLQQWRIEHGESHRKLAADVLKLLSQVDDLEAKLVAYSGTVAEMQRALYRIDLAGFSDEERARVVDMLAQWNRFVPNLDRLKLMADNDAADEDADKQISIATRIFTRTKWIDVVMWGIIFIPLSTVTGIVATVILSHLGVKLP